MSKTKSEIIPSFSYPGGIWLNDKCNPIFHKLLLDFIGLKMNGRILFKADKQGNGILIRFDDNKIGLDCFDYITEQWKNLQ